MVHANLRDTGTRIYSYIFISCPFSTVHLMDMNAAWVALRQSVKTHLKMSVLKCYRFPLGPEWLAIVEYVSVLKP